MKSRVQKVGIVWLCILLVSVTLSGCGATNMLRLTTNPVNARVEIPKLNLVLITPCDLPEEVEENVLIIVQKEGYRPFEGPIGDLTQIASGTYVLHLQKVER